MFELVPAQYDWHLIEATIAGDLAGIQMAFDCGASLSAKDERGRRLVRIAIESKRHDALELLVRLGADVFGDASFSPMLCATTSDNEQALRALAKAGAPASTRHSALREPLHLACELGFANAARTLIELGADLDGIERDGYTPVMAAAAKGRTSVIEVVLSNSPALETAESHGYTALFLAIAADNAVCVDALLSAGADLQARDLAGRTPLMAAAQKGRHAALSSILARAPSVDDTDPQGRSALFYAIDSDSLECVKLLLSAGANPLRRIQHKESMLRAYEWARLPNPFLSYCPKRPRIAQALLEREILVEHNELYEACAAPIAESKAHIRL